MYIQNVKIYNEIDPFFLESQIIGLQRIWRYNTYHRYKYDIIKNFNIIGNNTDPISLNQFMMLLISSQLKDWYQCEYVCLPIMCIAIGSTLILYRWGPT